ELVYDNYCRHRGLPLADNLGVRVPLPNVPVSFTDGCLGPQVQHPARQCGDVLIRDRHGNFTYQWAVVLDDLAQGINLIIRGEDILPSTGRQLLLRQILGHMAVPRFYHHPLILGADGQKLSKRDGATGIRELRRAGYSAAEVLGMAAYHGGLLPSPLAVAVTELGELLP
ncbi:MAG: tRNA glutamyl-Q(34) synthetase GluQRS, partial [Bacteroidetes bacterium]|nr:tRNA glutamyl-Q(34) synthetase GluQRS [Bacteroidota bacterium]